MFLSNGRNIMLQDIAKGLLVLVAIVGFGYASNEDQIEAERASDEYTEMVCLGRETGNEYGWPNYKNLEIDCGR